MAVICTGQGSPHPTNPHLSGCCWVEGQICPLRWRTSGGRIYDSTNTDLGTIDQAVNAKWSNSTVRTRVKAQIPTSGSVILCRAALETIGSDAQAATNRTRLNSGWNSNAAYVAQVRPAWARVEKSAGLAANSYNCSTWKGINGPECCFALPAVTNTALQAVFSVAAVTIRTAGGI